MIYAVCALALLGSQTPQSAADTVLATYKIADREVAAKIPATKLALPKCTGIADGEWTYLFDDSGKLRYRISNGGGWSEVASLHASAKAKIDDQTPLWKVKAVVMTRFDVLQKSEEGALLLRRSTLENSQVVASLEALARFAAIADAYGQGRYKVSLDVSIENEPMRFGPLNQIQPFGTNFCEYYFGPRINGGGFESEDKIYRGPYDSVFFIHPGWKEDGEPRMAVNGMPVSGIAFAPKEDMSAGQDLTVELLNRWCGSATSAEFLHARFGLAPDGNLINTRASVLSFAGMSAASKRERTATSRLVSHLALQKDKPAKLWAEVADDPTSKLAYIAGPVPKTADPIQFEESNGKNWLYVRIDFADFVGKNLKSSLEPKAVGWFSDNAYARQGDAFIVFELNANPGPVSDRNLLDIKAEAVSLGDESIKEFPELPKVNLSSTGANAYNYVFKPSNDPESIDFKIAKALDLKDGSSQAEKWDIVEMLSAREDAVKMNAAQAFTRVKEPNAVKPLIDMVAGFNLRVVEIALEALQFQGGPEADAAIHKALVSGRYGYVQAVAARLTALRNNPKDAQHIAILLAADGWTTWLAGAHALSQYDDKNAQTFLQGFVRMTDPAVRLEVTKGSNPAYSVPASNLLWSAVNDPSDLVRVAAYIKLIESSNDAHREEGYKGVRDDSIFVRLQLLEYMRKTPKEAHRKALQTAVADSDPEVRAAALAAFQALEGQVTIEEIQNTLTDQDPRVQKALVELALAKKIKLPTETVAMLRSSLDTEAANRAKGLAE